MEELLTAEEVMKILKFTNVITVYRLARARKIAYTVIGREYRFTKQAVEDFITQRTVPSAQQKDTE